MAAADTEQAVPEQVVTAFDDPERFTVKHPLQNRWTLWFDAPSSKKTTQKDWGQNLKKIVTIDSVEDFWGVYNNVVGTSEIPTSSNYHLFKEGIEPAWEDPANTRGGKWSFMLTKQKKGPELDKYWLHTMLACVGEQFTYGEEITGAVVSIRKAQDRICVWTRHADEREKCLKIGEEFKALLPTTDKIAFQSHSDSAKKRSSFSQDKYTI
ncbi:eukaryotic translation initiation factor 4E [Polyrhizophydium stewartii]|uniref:Eukaryotic translation initiation factor 4E n=1 Tax=Polyrhizophydium stewartii TaxID=2732419 RepID=A0ABR4N1N3_9FUNG|nr:eukaryotic translation initiation factor 4E [Polyrhizophydium stewartii]